MFFHFLPALIIPVLWLFWLYKLFPPRVGNVFSPVNPCYSWGSEGCGGRSWKDKALSYKRPDSGEVFAKLPAIVNFSLAREKGLLLLAEVSWKFGNLRYFGVSTQMSLSQMSGHSFPSQAPDFGIEDFWGCAFTLLAVLPPFLLNLGPDFLTIFCPIAIGNESHLKFLPLSPFIYFFFFIKV